MLIDVFRDYREADLLIVGEGTMGAELRRQAEGLDHVRFLGRLHPSELGQLYEGAVALVVPSIGYEVFGIVALEAFARRTPAIAHDLGALTEVIEDSGGGLLYRTTAELREAMDRLLARRRAARAARQPGLRRMAAAVERGRPRRGVLRRDRGGQGAPAVTAVILTYHAIEDGPRPLCIEPALFGEHAAAIAASGATCLTVRELGMALRDGALPERAVAITFDDGCESVVTNAAPVLAEHGLRATVFCGGRPSRRHERLARPARIGASAPARVADSSWRSWPRQGFEIGSHGYAHAPLNDDLRRRGGPRDRGVEGSARSSRRHRA